MKNAVFRDVTLRDYCQNHNSEESTASIIREKRIGELEQRKKQLATEAE
jgi:hypothetical protein